MSVSNNLNKRKDSTVSDRPDRSDKLKPRKSNSDSKVTAPPPTRDGGSRSNIRDGDTTVRRQSSNTKYYKKTMLDDDFRIVDKDEFYSISESMSGSSETFGCEHGPEGKMYSQKGLLKRNITKVLDPLPVDPKWNDECPASFGWDLAETLRYMLQTPDIEQMMDRFQAHLKDFARISSKGLRVDTLESFCIVTDYLLESLEKSPRLKQYLTLLLQNLNKPILLLETSDVVTYHDMIQHFLGFLSYLLTRLEDQESFDLVANALVWHLSAPDSHRGPGTVSLRHSLEIAAPVLHQSTSNMIAVARSEKFPVFLHIALLLASDNVDNCIEMMKVNIIENIFYRFDPYFPKDKLQSYEINPYDCQDHNVRLGDSSLNMPTTLSLLLVLLKSTKQYLEENPKLVVLPCPDSYAQRCFIWAYRYECRAREHRHQRITLTVIAAVLVKIFGDRLMLFSSTLMGDILSLSVITELPPRQDWIGTVNFNAGQQDVQFKKILIYFVVDLLKTFPYNKFMLESRHWLLGIMYLLDPGLCHLRSRWSPALFAEIRKTALQALVCVIPLIDHSLVREYGLVRRLLWYIEWYSESPYEINVLYWCIRVLQVAIFKKMDIERENTMTDLFDTHGIIIIIHLCTVLMDQKLPPLEKSQAVIALCLRLLSSSVNMNRRISCCVYPAVKWPGSVNTLARKMLDVVTYSLEKHFIISDRWLIALMNFVWEAIIWHPEQREVYVENDGVYNLLDLITMTRAPVQCIILAIVCDIATAGDAIGQLVSWRAGLGASNAYPVLVHRGATISSLLAAVFRDECKKSGIQLNEYGILQDLDFPLLSREAQSQQYPPEYQKYAVIFCQVASSLPGSRMSKAYALLHLLSEDLKERVKIADEAYNMYKNIELAIEDEVHKLFDGEKCAPLRFHIQDVDLQSLHITILVLCSHYLTLKLTEVWKETAAQNVGLVKKDQDILEDFISIGRAWAKEIKRQQEDVINRERSKELDKEDTLYAFLGRIRLNVALDALKSVRCVARSTDRDRINHDMINDAVFAHHRRALFVVKTDTPLLKTYKPPLDDQSVIGQMVKVATISPPTRKRSKQTESPMKRRDPSRYCQNKSSCSET